MARALFVIGDANPDVVLRGDVVPRFGQAEQLLDAAEVVMGGSATIMACGAALAGIATTVIASIGLDPFGDLTVSTLAGRGVHTGMIRRSATAGTGVSVILSAPHDRSILTYLGAMTDVRAEHLDVDAIPADAHVHAASFFLLPDLAAGLADLFAAVRRRGGTTSLDTNWDPSETWTGVADVLAQTDLFMPNANELLALTGHTDVDRAAASLTNVAPHGVTVAAKLGAAGGAVWTPDGLRCDGPSLPVTVVDTTGAGDSFDAGYLAGYLRGLPPATCIRLAAAAGSLSCRGAGGIARQATWDELAAAIGGVAG